LLPSPHTPLFPYTTLFRSHQHAPAVDLYVGRPLPRIIGLLLTRAKVTHHRDPIILAVDIVLELAHRPRVEQEVEGHLGQDNRIRSEEHTSELQSLRHLVCR